MLSDTTMEAIQIIGPEKLRQTRLPIPQLAEGEILIKTAFVGVCGTDVHLLQGKSFYYDHGFLKYPFVFGTNTPVTSLPLAVCTASPKVTGSSDTAWSSAMSATIAARGGGTCAAI